MIGGQGSDGMWRGCRGCPYGKMLCSLSRIPFMFRAWGGRSFPSRALRRLRPARDSEPMIQLSCSDS